MHVFSRPYLFQISLLNTGTYQLVFEGVVGTSFSSDIAIDDIIITTGECQPPAGCDFEKVRRIFVLNGKKFSQSRVGV